MSDRMASVEAAAQQLRRAVEQDRESDIVTAAEAAQTQDDRIEREADPKIMLGREVLALTDRMRWLVKHPRMPRFLGGSAIRLAAADRLIQTPLLFAVEHDTDITEGYRFRTPVAVREGDRLDVECLLVHTPTGRRRQIEDGSYQIYVSGIDSDNPIVRVAGKTFRDHKEKVEFGPDGCFWKIREFSAAHPVLGADTEARSQWNALLADSEEGIGWSYPSELYIDPLGLVGQANSVLGTKRA